ncbi:unnamed protein product [Rhizophagus irregularis]|uniref:Uncharacterized protein n=1 Tax=Rhizophagus irregularis TaxID=588596 RepID=A0A915ZIW2_9GLOM|nr:unnamed protein product [Rhizophagus irregularis]CAB5379147.1 unnamed protein product [Rhizophagus irregularis]
MFCIEVSREEVTEGGVVVVLAGGAEAPVGAGSSVSIASSAVLTRFVVTEGTLVIYLVALAKDARCP